MLVDVGSEIPILLDLESHTEKKKKKTPSKCLPRTETLNLSHEDNKRGLFKRGSSFVGKVLLELFTAGAMFAVRTSRFNHMG